MDKGPGGATRRKVDLLQPDGHIAVADDPTLTLGEIEVSMKEQGYTPEAIDTVLAFVIKYRERGDWPRSRQRPS